MSRGNNKCVACGQWAGRSHKCPTPQTPEQPDQILTINGFVDRPEPAIVNERVAKARKYLAEAPALAYHGTSTGALSNIIMSGSAISKPYLTPDEEIAEYYAQEAADNDGSEPVILAVPIPDPTRLRVDHAALEEPVMVDEDEVEGILDEVSEENPDWVSGAGYLIIPDDRWDVSWSAARSARYEGDLDNWEIIDRDS